MERRVKQERQNTGEVRTVALRALGGLHGGCPEGVGGSSYREEVEPRGCQGNRNVRDHVPSGLFQWWSEPRLHSKNEPRLIR